MQKNIIKHLELVYAIYKHLLITPGLHEDLGFKSIYLDVSEGNKGDTPELDNYFVLKSTYDSMRHYIYEKNMTFSYKVFEMSYFDNRRELRSFYYDSNNLEFNIKKQITSVTDALKTLFKTIEDSYTYYSTDYIEESAYRLVREQRIIWSNALLNIKARTVQALNDNDDNDKILDMAENFFDNLERDFPKPMAKTNGYSSFCDPRLRIKVSDKLYPSLIEPLNKYLNGGFRKQTVTGFLTKTGGGKSTLLFTLAADALKSGFNVVFVNLEMNDYEVNTNLMSSLTNRYTHDQILKNLPNDEFMNDLDNDLNSRNLGRHYILSNRDDYQPVNMSWIKRSVKRQENIVAHETGNPDFKFDFIFIDYLYLMTTVRSMNRNARSDEMYRQIVIDAHEFAQNEDYAVVSVFQGNRGAEQKMANQESLNLADVGDSYGAFKDIDFIFSIQRIKNEGDGGIAISPLKTRQYDGEWDSIFVPYNRNQKRYESWNAEDYYMSEPDNAKDSEQKKWVKYEHTLKDFLDADERLQHMPISFIRSKIKNEKISKMRPDDFIEEFSARGWKIEKYKRIENPDEAEKIIKEALNKMYGKQQDRTGKIIITDSGYEFKDPGADFYV